MLVLDSLHMLVTSDPVAEIDQALADAATRLHAARTAGDITAAQALEHWINIRLDQRLGFRDPLQR